MLTAVQPEMLMYKDTTTYLNFITKWAYSNPELLLWHTYPEIKEIIILPPYHIQNQRYTGLYKKFDPLKNVLYVNLMWQETYITQYVCFSNYACLDIH